MNDEQLLQEFISWLRQERKQVQNGEVGIVLIQQNGKIVRIKRIVEESCRAQDRC